jgi:thioredoxin reductase (NADPH)
VLSGPDLKVEGRLPKCWKEEREPYLLETSVPGIFVAGDVRRGSAKRVASAVGEGSISVQFMHQYLARF